MGMNICDARHDTIAYTTPCCPLCDLLEEFEEAEKDRDRFEEQLQDLEYEHDVLMDKAKAACPEVFI